MRPGPEGGPPHEVVLAAGDGVVHVLAAGSPARAVVPDALPDTVRDLEATHPRWVWADTAVAYRPLLGAGVRVERCHDLRLARVILRNALGAPAPAGQWDTAVVEPSPGLLPLFTAPPLPPEEVVAERARQQAALAGSSDPGRLATLLAAESAGALLAAEMRHDGLPWSVPAHERLLADALGPRPTPGARPAVLERLAEEIRSALAAPHLNPDSPAEVLRALRAAGLAVRTTRNWELQALDHPAIAPLLEFKKLSRLHSANGWAWLDQWVVADPDGRTRFHPDYVPGGVVTGRWATRGGGALQLPKQVRGAVVADPGWKLVVADVAQLEPRVLAAMARDERMATAARGRDLYQGLVDQGVVDTRAHAKVAMLGALYGATTGRSAELMPCLVRAFPRAIGLVEEAARRGEAGGAVRTWLGRTSPLPPAGAVSDPRRARDWGHFTRNFVVQGTAAEWALAWIAGLRQALRRLGEPRLVFFLHDEVVVHSPAGLADDVAAAVADAAAGAGTLLFGGFPVDFPLDVAVVDDYGQAG